MCRLLLIPVQLLAGFSASAIMTFAERIWSSHDRGPHHQRFDVPLHHTKKGATSHCKCMVLLGPFFLKLEGRIRAGLKLNNPVVSYVLDTISGVLNVCVMDGFSLRS